MACNAFQIEKLSIEVVESTIQELIRTGASVTGQNPWSVNLNKHGIKLIADYNPESKNLNIVVTNKKFYLSCGKVENELRKKIRLY